MQVSSDHLEDGARLQGIIVDTVPSAPPGPVHWASAVSGDFSDTADWTGGFVPVSYNDAILDPAGAAFTVTAGASETVNSLQTAANATLAITAGTFAAAAGTGSGVNAGAIVVGDRAALAFAGTLANSGSIGLAGAGAATRLIMDGSGAIRPAAEASS